MGKGVCTNHKNLYMIQNSFFFFMAFVQHYIFALWLSLSPKKQKKSKHMANLIHFEQVSRFGVDSDYFTQNALKSVIAAF